MAALLAMTAIGVILGLRFKVFVLIPAIAVTSVGTLAIDTGHGANIWSSLLVTVFMMIGLQVGYMAGTAVRFGIGRAADVVAIAPRR